MSTLVLRGDKLVPLTYEEMDQNLINLNTDKLENITNEPIGDLSDVVLTSPAINELLGYDGTNWINVDRAHASIIKAYCKNASVANSLAKGTPVYQVGTQGAAIIVAPADASDPLKMPAVGILGEDLAPEAEGELLVLGEIQGVDTSGFTAGDLVYVAPGGGYTNIKPTDAAHQVQFLGIVIKVHETSGSGFITGTMSPDLIKYNGGDKFYGWNGTSWEVLPQILDDLSNVSILAASTNDVLTYDAINQQWINYQLKPVAYTGLINDLDDVILTLPANNQVMKYDGIEWINTDLKTINGNSLLGSGNIIVSGGEGGGLASLVAYNSDGTQDDITLNAYATLNQITIAQELIYDNDAVISIESTSNYGWRDLFAPIDPRSSQSGPTWTLFRDGIYLYAFPDNQNKEVFATFHIDHDYAMGTKAYPHVHFTVNTTNSGTVRWGFEYTVAKGHQQATGSIYGATTTVYVEQVVNGLTDQYKHFVTEVPEVDAISAALLEPDTIILVRLFRDAASANDTYVGNVFGIQTDMHYQANRFATINKAPNFFGA